MTTYHQNFYAGGPHANSTTMQTQSINPRHLNAHWCGTNAVNSQNFAFVPLSTYSTSSSQAVPSMTNPWSSNCRWPGPIPSIPQQMSPGQIAARQTLASAPASLIPDFGQRQLKRKLSTMLQSEQLELFESNGGEFKVICGERTWKVYGHIVAPRCNFFAAAAKWKKEQEEKIIDMNDDDPYAVDMLLRYLYTRDSELVGLTAPFDDNPAQMMAKIAVVADKYDQPDLLAQVKIELMKLIENAKQLEEPDKRARDALLALVKLREHDAGSGQLHLLQMIILRFLNDSRQLGIMDDAMSALLENEVQADPSLATLLIKFCAGGRISSSSSLMTGGSKSLQSPINIE